MALHLTGDKQWPEPMLTYCQLEPRNKNQKNLLKFNIFIQENALEIAVCKIVTILSIPQCVNSLTAKINDWYWMSSILSVVSQAFL